VFKPSVADSTPALVRTVVLAERRQPTSVMADGFDGGLTVTRMLCAEPAMVLALRGELDLTGGVEAVRAIRRALREGPPALILDLADVSFVDVTGLRALIQARRLAATSGARLALRNLRPEFDWLLQFSGLRQIFDIE
jgi:anti-anti-sigma factor